MPAYGPATPAGAFPAARAAFEQLLADLFDHQGASHADAEEFIAARGREVHRLPQVTGSDQVVRRAAEAGH
ncbi:hypothetical protein O1L44_19680 [Streptomyces noursei]|uniref:hypothetical protein n=1 Tax=Streptomyces noursei TaxID=1971 RepID=UPI00081CBBE2|nr:hypothetical protein SNOUR_24100 [Streptomyces noursei ATCC 11455]MCZ0994899.1 hypothetical protein [Streptomyces noursei]